MTPIKEKQKRIELSDGLRATIKTFQPEPLDEDNFDVFYNANTMVIRTGNEHITPLGDIFDDCTTPLNRNAHLLSGHRGCGKSTELYSLKLRLEKEGHPVCMIDCQSEMNLNLADCWDIMLFITEGLCRIADKYDIELDDGLVSDIYNYILQDIEISSEFTDSRDINVGLTLSLIASIKGGLQMGDTQRTTLKTKMEKRGADWKRYVNEISDVITDAMKGHQPILIFEDMDKIQPFHRALDIFMYDTLAKMPFPIIYTFPIAEIYSSKFAALKGLYKTHVLPMIKVHNADKSEHTAGIAVIEEIVGKRADLGFFDKKALRLLVEQTGGALRHLFECILTACRIAIRRGSEKIEIDDAKRALERLTSELTRSISITDNEILANIYTNINHRKQLEDTTIVLEHMHSLVVLEYQNGDRWHDLHPLVVAFLKDRGIFDVPK